MIITLLTEDNSAIKTGSCKNVLLKLGQAFHLTYTFIRVWGKEER